MLETLFTGFNLTEAPRFDDIGRLYFGDVMGAGLHRYDEKTGVETVDPLSEKVGGCVMTADGRVVYSSRGGLRLFDPTTGMHRALPISLDGAAMNDSVNDIEAGPNGELFGGAIDHSGFERGVEPRPGFLFRADGAGTAHRLRTVVTPNGIEFDQRGRVYVSESGEGVFSYALKRDGTLDDRTLFAGMPDSDGIALDTEGGLWITRYLTHQIEYRDGSGRLLRSLDLPFSSTTSVTFGGRDLRQLHVTGGHLTKRGTGGIVRISVENPGCPARKFRLAM